MYSFNSVKNIDWGLVILALLLIAFGLATLYSLNINQEVLNFLKFKKQILFALLGLILFFLFAFIDYRFFESYGYLIYILGALLLLAVLFFGREIRGTHSWFSFFGMTFQPVEIAKITTAIGFAKYLSKYIDGKIQIKRDLAHLAVASLFIALPIFLLFLQPDLGSALIFFALGASLFLLIGIKRQFLLFFLLGLILISIFLWFFVLEGYQKDRIYTFLNPTRDVLDAGYNVRASQIAIGSGKFFGRGLGLGPQSRLNFLPEQETDFVFAVIGESLGFFGVSLILIFLLLLLFRILKIIREVRDPFALFLSLGLLVIFLTQILINIGMNLGLFPVTGLPLPFLSYGGSSLISSLIALGMLESVARINKG